MTHAGKAKAIRIAVEVVWLIAVGIAARLSLPSPILMSLIVPLLLFSVVLRRACVDLLAILAGVGIIGYYFALAYQFAPLAYAFGAGGAAGIV